MHTYKADVMPDAREGRKVLCASPEVDLVHAYEDVE